MNYRSVIKRLALATAMVTMTNSVMAADPIRIGEINSYKSQPAFLEPYRNG